MNDTIMTLKAGIEAVFADVTYPGDDNLTSNYSPLSINNDEGVADYFRQTSWRGHSVQNLRCHSGALSFFTPAAFHYYLPAFIIADIEDPVEADIISDSIIFDFTPSSSSSLADRIGLFSEPQIAAVKSYIDYMIVRDGDYGFVTEARDFLCKRLAESSTTD